MKQIYEIMIYSFSNFQIMDLLSALQHPVCGVNATVYASVCITVDFVKRVVFTIVGETRCNRNDRCCIE